MIVIIWPQLYRRAAKQALYESFGD